MQRQRSSGILLHLTSLPGPHGSGDFGPAAYHFVDWLATAGQSLWQVLPLNPVGPGHSPYMSPSAFALEPMLIDLRDLVERGWLDADWLARESEPLQGHDPHRIDHDRMVPFRMAALRAAAASYFAASPDGDASFQEFCQTQADWLHDYALFMAIAQRSPEPSWQQWSAPLANRLPEALARVAQEWSTDLQFWKFTQWVTFRQWGAVKAYANERGVQIVGDVPIFVAPHSADVWAHRALFDLNADGSLRVFAGVPPDYFSETGQHWGNPLYRWDQHRETGFAWWIKRVKACLASADWVRIDHFRGFAAHWEIPASAKTAIDGQWQPGPGGDLFDALTAALGQLPIIAEDLGVITEDVTALRTRYQLPGMKVLQFAFANDANNAYLPHNHEPESVVYSGTHDNDTSLGWFAQAPAQERAMVQTYLKTDGHEIGWDLIHSASQSVAMMAIYPYQDVLCLGSDARMNRPGVAQGCWGWRFSWDQVQPWHAQRLKDISAVHGRNRL